MTYFHDVTKLTASLEISFDSSKIAVLCVRHTLVSKGRDTSVWDLPSGALLHNLQYDDCDTIQYQK